MQSICTGGVNNGMSCAFDHMMRSECRFEKLESEIRVKLNFTDESLHIWSVFRAAHDIMFVSAYVVKD